VGRAQPCRWAKKQMRPRRWQRHSTTSEPSNSVVETSRGREKLERSIKVADRAGEASEAGRAYLNLTSVLIRRREWALHDRYNEAGMHYCRKHGLDAWLTYAQCGQAESQLAQGSWTAAADTATSILSKPVEGLAGSRYHVLLVLALVRARRGDPGYWPLLDEALELANVFGELQFLAPVAAARAEAAWLEGRPSAIAAETDSAFRSALERGEPSFIGELAVWRWRGGLLDAPPAVLRRYTDYKSPENGSRRSGSGASTAVPTRQRWRSRTPTTSRPCGERSRSCAPSMLSRRRRSSRGACASEECAAYPGAPVHGPAPTPPA